MAEVSLPQPITVGQRAPLFQAQTQSGSTVVLSDLLAQHKWVLLIFYPSDMTPGCTKQLCGIRDVYADFASRGVHVLGVNKGSAASHQRFIDAFNFPFDILVDSDNKIRDAYGAVKMFFKNMTIRRGAVLIDPSGIVQYVYWGQQNNHEVIKVVDAHTASSAA